VFFLQVLKHLKKYFAEGQVVRCMVMGVVMGKPSLSMVGEYVQYDISSKISCWTILFQTPSHFNGRLVE